LDDEVTGEAGLLQVAPPTLSEAVKAKIEEGTDGFSSIRMLDEAELVFQRNIVFC